MERAYPPRGLPMSGDGDARTGAGRCSGLACRRLAALAPSGLLLLAVAAAARAAALAALAAAPARRAVLPALLGGGVAGPCVGVRDRRRAALAHALLA